MKLVMGFLLFLGLFFNASAYANYPQVEISTNAGTIVVELYPDRAPQTVKNFLQYVNNGFYSGTIFHRVIDKFIIQGGGYTQDMHLKETLPPIPNEADNGLKNERGTLSMARALKPDSATTQFFINLDDNKTLNYYRPEPDLMGYCVFGRVIRGMEVVEKIAHSPTTSMGKITDIPSETIVIEKVAMLDVPVQAEAPAKKKSKSPVVKSSPSKKKGTTSG